MLAVIDALDASERVKDDLRGIYRILAEAEAAAHGCDVDSTHFHEAVPYTHLDVYKRQGA